MRRMRAKSNREPWQNHDDDLHRLQKIAVCHGAIVGLPDLRKAWEAYSESMAAGWLGLDDDDDVVWDRLSPFLEEM